MSYATYRPELDPFFEDYQTTPNENARPDWGDRSADPKSNRRFNLDVPVFLEKKVEILKVP